MHHLDHPVKTNYSTFVSQCSDDMNAVAVGQWHEWFVCSRYSITEKKKSNPCSAQTFYSNPPESHTVFYIVIHYRKPSISFTRQCTKTIFNSQCKSFYTITFISVELQFQTDAVCTFSKCNTKDPVLLYLSPQTQSTTAQHEHLSYLTAVFLYTVLQWLIWIPL